MASRRERAIRSVMVAVLLATAATTTNGWCQVMKEPSDPLDGIAAPVAEPARAGKCAAPQPQAQGRARDTVDEAAAVEHTRPSWIDLLRSLAEALRERLLARVPAG